MSALGTALLCTFIEKAFKGLKGLVVFWRSSLLKGKIVALQFFVLLYSLIWKGFWSQKEGFCGVRITVSKMQNSIFGRNASVTNCIHSWPANTTEYLSVSTFLWIGKYKILMTVSVSPCCYELLTNLLSWSFIAKVLQIKTRVGQQHSPLLQSAPHFHHRRQRHLR